MFKKNNHNRCGLTLRAATQRLLHDQAKSKIAKTNLSQIHLNVKQIF